MKLQTCWQAIAKSMKLGNYAFSIGGVITLLLVNQRRAVGFSLNINAVILKMKK